jgi:hypothetical protein
MQYDLGYIDLDERTLQPLENPFGARPGTADPTKKPGNEAAPDSGSMKRSGETEASNAEEQLARGIAGATHRGR